MDDGREGIVLQTLDRELGRRSDVAAMAMPGATDRTGRRIILMSLK